MVKREGVTSWVGEYAEGGGGYVGRGYVGGGVCWMLDTLRGYVGGGGGREYVGVGGGEGVSWGGGGGGG